MYIKKTDIEDFIAAAQSGDMTRLSFFIQKCGAPIINARDAEGKTALIHAADHSQNQVAAALIKEGADVNISFDSPCRENTPISIAAAHDNSELVSLLLKHGTIDLHTAFYCAVYNGSLGAMTLLQQAGASPKTTYANGSTAMMVAADNSKIKPERIEPVLAFLEEHGVDINERDSYGRTALHHAVRSGSISMVETLLLKGAQPFAKDEHGWTALDFNKSLTEIFEAARVPAITRQMDKGTCKSLVVKKIRGKKL